MKARLTRSGVTSGGNSAMTMPDFTPNSQHNRTFFQRLRMGFNIQSSSSTSLLPAISSLGLSAGYMLNDKMVVGVGSAWQLGVGNGLDHFQFSNQGVSLRSFMDLRMKGSFWLTGGGEYTYMQTFSSFRDF